MIRIRFSLVFIFLWIGLTACEHKDLCYAHPQAEAVPSLLPPLGNDYVVVPDGGAEKVVCESGCVHQYLRPAKAIIVLVFKNFHIFKEHFRAIRREFEYPCGSGGQHSMNRHTDS